MRAQITYNGGKSYTIGNHTFKGGKTATITDTALIEKLKSNSAFAVGIIPEMPVRQPPRPPVAPQKILRRPVQ